MRFDQTLAVSVWMTVWHSLPPPLQLLGRLSVILAAAAVIVAIAVFISYNPTCIRYNPSAVMVAPGCCRVHIRCAGCCGSVAAAVPLSCESFPGLASFTLNLLALIDIARFPQFGTCGCPFAPILYPRFRPVFYTRFVFAFLPSFGTSIRLSIARTLESICAHFRGGYYQAHFPGEC